MARVSVEVPSELVGPVRETVLLLYQATAESLHLSLRAHSEGRGSPGVEACARLAQLDELRRSSAGRPAAAAQRAAELLHDALRRADRRRRAPAVTASSLARRAPWSASGGGGEVLALGSHALARAQAELLHDAFYGALIDAGERLAVRPRKPGATSCPLERVRGGGGRGARPPQAAAAAGALRMTAGSSPCR